MGSLGFKHLCRISERWLPTAHIIIDVTGVNVLEKSSVNVHLIN